MSAKISNLNELNPIFREEEKISEGVLGMIDRFDLKRILQPLSSFKTKGISLKLILSSLILCRFRGLSIYAMRKSGLTQIDENTLYRIMNNTLMDWRSLVRGMAQQFMRIVSKRGESNNSVRCFVIDDTVVAKTGKTIEGISKVHDHVIGGYVLGFKALLLSLWDGKTLLPIDFSLHRENKNKNWGLKAKDLKSLFTKKRDNQTHGNERFEELDKEKPSVVLEMLRRACKHHILASYVLIDSWFMTDTIIQGIRQIRKGMMHVVGLCKMDKRKFTVDGRELNSDAIIKMKTAKKGSIHKSSRFKSTRYIKVDAIYKGTAVRLFYVMYKGTKKWKLLLTTDLSLSFVKTMELYQIRWSIEVLFKECKQYLRLGQAQNTDFDGQIADTAITLITHIILSLQLRFQAYETMGGLFGEVQNQMIQDTICERILKMVLEIIEQLLEFLSIDLEETLERLFACDESAEKVRKILMAVNELHHERDKNEMAA